MLNVFVDQVQESWRSRSPFSQLIRRRTLLMIMKSHESMKILGSLVKGAALFSVISIFCAGCEYGGGSNANVALTSFVAIADLNGDGQNDLAVSKIEIQGAPPHPGSISVLLQNPNAPGSFLPSTAYAAGADPWFLVVRDLNADMLPDLIVANETGTISILLQNPSSVGTFLNKTSIPTGDHPYSIAIDDLNGDNLLDLAVGRSSGVSLHFQRPDNHLDFLPAEEIPVDPELGAHHVAISDMDGDGYPDLVVSNAGEFFSNTNSLSGGSVSVFLQDGQSPGVFNPPITSAAADETQPFFLAIAELNGDGHPDLAVVNLGTPSNGYTASVSVLLQDPATPGAFSEPKDYPTGYRSQGVVISDLDADAWPDLAVVNIGSVSVLLNDPVKPGSFLPANNYEGTDDYTAIAVGDLNADSQPDLAIAADGVPVMFQNLSAPGEFLPRTPVE
jgi:hypothetical protein